MQHASLHDLNLFLAYVNQNEFSYIFFCLSSMCHLFVLSILLLIQFLEKAIYRKCLFCRFFLLPFSYCIYGSRKAVLSEVSVAANPSNQPPFVLSFPISYPILGSLLFLLFLTSPLSCTEPHAPNHHPHLQC